jgi:hypothetical protein
MKEEWDKTNASWKKNFKCFLMDTGRWDRGNFQKEKGEYGKWVFNIEPINPNITAPTNADQRNFFTGLMEAERRNDNFILENGEKRPPQKWKKLNMFKKFISDINKEWGEENEEP